MNVITKVGFVGRYNKFEIAIEYLDVASGLFLSNENYFSCLHLAGAAEEILRKYCESSGMKSEQSEYRDWLNRLRNAYELSVKGQVKERNRPKNSIKHFDIKVDGDAVIDFDIKWEADLMLNRAYRNLEVLDMLDECPKSLIEVYEKTNIIIEL